MGDESLKSMFDDVQGLPVFDWLAENGKVVVSVHHGRRKHRNHSKSRKLILVSLPSVPTDLDTYENRSQASSNDTNMNIPKVKAR